jgi:uncharacterized protein (UPF0297 family)
MKLIPLQNSNRQAKCDDEDYEYLNQFEWYLLDGHATRFVEMDGADSLVAILMEDEVMERATSTETVGKS